MEGFVGRKVKLLLTCILALGVGATWLAAQGTAPRPGGPVVPFEEPRVPPDAEVAFPEGGSGDNRIDALLSGYQWPGLTITYSFYSDAVFAGTYYGGETGVREVSAGVKQNVRAIMAWYAAATNLNLVEVTETASTIGQIRILLSSGPAFAYTYYPSSTAMFHLAGDVHLNPGYDRLGDTNGFQHPPGEHGYVTLIHEIGHALGLKHPHTGSPTLPAAQDNHTHTVMSYQFPGRSPGTPMGYDLLALQYLYGVGPNNPDNDVYTFSPGTKQTIWDSGGANTLDLSSLAQEASGYRLDLQPLGWLSSWSDYQGTYLNTGTVLGPNVIIQTLINSAGNDTIYANASANVFGGYAPTRTTGQDQIVGATRGDVIDLSAFSPSTVQETPAGNDLVINLGSPGTITLKAYYLTDPPTIRYGSGTVPTVSIADASVAEGNAGTASAVFMLTVSSPPPAAVSVGWATATGTASAGSDFTAASGTVTFAAGQTQKTIGVTVLGDTLYEGNETFAVTLSNPSAGLSIYDGQATGTIVDDDPVPNQLPTAQASATPTSGIAPLTVQFSSAGSADPDGSIASYAWAFGDGATSTAASPSYTYFTPGTFVATVTVTDNQGATAAKSVTITVTAPNQTPTAEASATPTSGIAPLTVQFSSAGSADPDGSIASYAWAFGDGATSTAASPSYTYFTPGTFVATVTVTDNQGATAAKSVTITVTAPNQTPTARPVPRRPPASRR